MHVLKPYYAWQCGLSETVRLGTAPVVRRTVGKAVDGSADLRVVDSHLEATHGDIA